MSFSAAFRVLVNRLGLAATTLVALSQATLSGAGNFPSAADGFDPNVNGNVYALALQADGRILAAGSFNALQPNGAAIAVTHNNLARINVDGSVDATFNPDISGPINTVVVQADGKILIGGKFTGVSGVARNNLARLNADGSVDAAFDPNANGAVNALALQADGKILVGGAFTTLKSTTTRNRLARLNTDGSVDTGFNPNANNVVFALAVQGDGKVLVGGGFTTLQPTGAAVTVTRNRAARLNADGTLDAAFDPGADNIVTTIALQLDGRILLGGNFLALQSNLQLNGGVDPTPRYHLARFYADGTLDSSFDPSPNGNLSSITIQPDGRILLGGNFSTLHPVGSNSAIGRSYFCRVNLDGSFDPTFDPGANSVVSASVVQADGQIVAGGYFTQLLSHNTAAIPTVRNHLARVNPDGTLDITFDPNTSGGVLTTLVQPDGKILIGGSFTSIGGTTRNFLARINADATVDLGFNPNPNGPVQGLARQADGKIIIVGSFTKVGQVSRNYVARLNADGSVDDVFNPNASASVNAVVIQPSDGKVIIGGFFTNLEPNGATTTTARDYIARLNTDGSTDDSFNYVLNNQVSSLLLQTDGKIILGGSFSFIQRGNSTDTVSRSNIARINTDGSVDPAFNPNFNQGVQTMALQGDGKILVGGSFTALQPNTDLTVTTRNHLVRLNTNGTVDTTFDPNANSPNAQIYSLAVQGDGKILVAGAFTSIAGYAINNFVRLNGNGTLDPFFNPNPSSPVRSVVLQADGRILIGGSFISLQAIGDATPTKRLHFARLTTDGTIDTSFDPAVGGQTGGQVTVLAVQADGRIIMAGSLDNNGGSSSSNITRFNNDSTADSAFNPSADGVINAVAVRPASVSVLPQSPGFAWLNSDGSLRLSFAPGSSFQLNGQVSAVARQADGKILVGGLFTNPAGGAGSNLLRVNPDGSLDTTYTPSPDGNVEQLVVLANNQVLVAGNFLNIGATTRHYVAILNGDGSVASFDPNASGEIHAVAVQPDGKILLGGAFSTLLPNGATTATARSFLARVNADGTVDTNFNTAANAQVSALALQPDGSILVGGSFTTLLPNGATTATTRNNIGRLNADGSLDTNFDPNANGTVQTIAVQSNGQILLGGAFTSIGGTTRNHIARVAADGTLDAGYDPNADSLVGTIALQADGRALVGGFFSTIAGVARNRVARLNADGTIDTSFNPNANAGVNTVVVQTDGSLIAGGSFTALRPNGVMFVGGAFAHIGSATVSYLALLNDDGTASTVFRPNPDGAVNALIAQADGRTLVAGNFANIAGVARNRLARFNGDGSLDAAFNPNANNPVSTLAVQADGRILLGGSFTAVGGAARNRIARLNADGSLDALNPGADNQVNAVAVQADGRILLGGSFTNVGGTTRNRVARLNADGSVDTTFNPGADGTVNAVVVQADGRILLGGAFANIAGAARSRLARLNADGSIDPTFDPGPDNTISALALQADGRLLVGGSFARISGLARNRFARLAATSSAIQSIAVSSDMTTLTWTRSGTGPELNGATFEQSSDNSIWTSLGQASRVGTTTTWRLGGLGLSRSAQVYIRARGIAPTSQFGSTGIIEAVRLFAPAPVITSATVVTGTAGTAFVYAIAASNGTTGYSATGLPAGLSIDPVTGIITGTPTQSGTFLVTVTATNSGGTTSTTLTLTISPAGAASSSGSRLISLAARARVSSDSPLITGFVITGTVPETVLLRGIGPSLSSYGVVGMLATPRLRVFDAKNQLLFEAGRWDGKSELAAIFAQVGAFPLAADSADAATVVTLPPGVYTMQVFDPYGVGGVALAEIYEVNTSSAGTRLIEMSARGTTDTGENILIGGLVISGSSPKRVLIRGIGPGLAALGVSTALSNPILSIYSSQTQIIAQNDNWGTPVTVNASYPAASAASIIAANASSGAFPLIAGSADAAVILTLAPGSYTVQVAGVNGTSGVAMVEVYDLP